jgi:hypothetical protein
VQAVGRSARSYFAGREAANVATAVALIAGTGVARTVGNFMIGLSRPPYPVRLFTDEG